MNRPLQTKRTVFLATLLWAALAAVPAVHAGKPPPAPTPTPAPLDGGSIYYYERGVYLRQVHQVNPDGTGDRALAGMFEDDRLNSATARFSVSPSHLPHNGQRWFADSRETGGGIAYFPDGKRLYDVFAYYEGMSTPLQLTGNAAACIEMSVAAGWVIVQWQPDAAGQADAAIAWLGTRWADAGDGGSPCDTRAETGIFRAGLTFDGSGNVTGIAAQPTAPEVVLPYSDYYSFSWRPDGQQVAYTVGGKLYLHPDPSSLNPLNGGQLARDVQWSPNGGKLAFHGATSTGVSATFVINPNGTGLTLLAKGQKAKNSTQPNIYHRALQWSPSGSHLIYVEETACCGSTSSYYDRVRRMAADGTGNVILTTVDGPGGSWVMGWGAN